MSIQDTRHVQYGPACSNCLEPHPSRHTPQPSPPAPRQAQQISTGLTQPSSNARKTATSKATMVTCCVIGKAATKRVDKLGLGFDAVDVRRVCRATHVVFGLKIGRIRLRNCLGRAGYARGPFPILAAWLVMHSAWEPVMMNEA